MVAWDSTLRERHRQVIARGKPCCWLCGQPIDYSIPSTEPMGFVVDHVVPLARGGADVLANKKAAHRICNRKKGARLDGGPVVKRSGSIVLPGQTD